MVTASSPSDAELERALRLRVRSGFELPEDILRSLPDLLRRDEARAASLEAFVHRELELLAAEQKQWPKVTMNDRIMIAFIELTRAGIIALEDAGASMTDGWHVVESAAREHRRARGAVFYHWQDLQRGVDGQGLLLAFGSLPQRHPEERARSIVIGREVLAALTKHRIPAEWDGTLEHRIRILPFVWQRRLLPT